MNPKIVRRLAAAVLAGAALAFVPGALAQEEIPVESIEADPALFSPNGDGIQDSTTVTIVTDPGLTLYLDVFDNEQNLIRSGLPLQETAAGTYTTVWDGRTSASTIVAEGDGPFYIKASLSPNGDVESELNGAAAAEVDLTPPAGVNVGVDGGAQYVTEASREVTLTISTSDAVTAGYLMRIAEGATDAAFEGVAWQTLTATKKFTLSAGEGEKTIRLQIRDEAGNVGSSTSTTILDLTNPSISIAINDDAAQTSTSAVTLSIVATDPNGVPQMRLSNDGGQSFPNGWEPLAATKAWALSPGAGTRTVLLEVRDSAGRYASATDTISVVLTAPLAQRLHVQEGATFAPSPSVTLKVERPDDTYDQIAFSNTGLPGSFSAAEPWPSTGNTATKSWVLDAPTTEGLKTVYFRLFKGGTGTDVSAQIVLDLTNPAGTFAVQDASGNALTVTRSAGVHLAVSATDANGVTGVRFANNPANLADRDFEPVPVGTRFFCLGDGTITNPDHCLPPGTTGTKTIHMQLRDAAGRVSGEITQSVIFDNVAPTGLSLSTGPGFITGSGVARTRFTDVALKLTASDAITPLSQLEMSFVVDQGDYTPWEPFSAEKSLSLPDNSRFSAFHVINMKVRDRAGNEAGAAALLFYLDVAAPIGAFDLVVGEKKNPEYTTTRTVSLDIKASDDLSGGSGITHLAVWFDLDAEPAAVAFSANPEITLPDIDGLRTLHVKVFDAVGNALALPDRTITLDRVAPSIATRSPAPGASGVAVTAKVKVGFAEAMNETSVEAATKLSPQPAAPKFNWSADGTQVEIDFGRLANNRLYTMKIGAGALDLAGNAFAADVSWQFTTIAVDVENDPPRITSFGPTGTVATRLPTFRATYADDNGVDAVRVTLAIDGQLADLTGRVGPTGFEFTPSTELAEGPHTVVLTVVDFTGLTASVAWTFTVATTAPPPVVEPCPAPCLSTPVELRPGTPTEILSEHSVVRSLSLTSAADEAPVEIGFQVDTLAAAPTGVSTPPGTIFRLLDITLKPRDAGTAAPRLDDAKIRFAVERSWLTSNGIAPTQVVLLHWDGRAWEPLKTRLVSEAAGIVTFEADTPGFSPFAIAGDAQTPSVTAIEPAPGASGKAFSALRFRVADNVGIDPTTIEASVDGVAVPVRAAGAEASGALSKLGDGEHTAVARVRDLVGNAGSATWKFTTDATPPTLALTESAEAIRGAWSDATTGVAAGTLKVTVDGVDVTSSATKTADGFSYTIPKDLAAGKHTLVATVSDNAGNAATASEEFEVSQQQPPPTQPPPTTPPPTAPTEKGGIPTWVWLLLAAVVAGIVVVVVVRRKK